MDGRALDHVDRYLKQSNWQILDGTTKEYVKDIGKVVVQQDGLALRLYNM